MTYGTVITMFLAAIGLAVIMSALVYLALWCFECFQVSSADEHEDSYQDRA